MKYPLWPRHLYRTGQRIFHWFNPATRRRIAVWEGMDGLAFVRTLHVAPGNVVLDFGSGPGHYSVPSALVVGERGLVCAVDQNALRRRRLARRARALDLRNIRPVAQLDDVSAALTGKRCDAVLAYDVLHFMDADERCQLYERFRQLLAERGLFSVHPKHVHGDAPSRYFAELTVDDVAHEIEAAGFRLRERLTVTLWHDHGPISGTVLNFERADLTLTGAGTK